MQIDGPTGDSDPTLHTPVPGTRLHRRYTLRRILGRGGMAHVWLAHDHELNEDITLKILPNVVAQSRIGLRALREEAMRSRKLTHPNIVRVHDFVPDPRCPAIAMEYIDGPSLADMQSRQPNGVFEPVVIAKWLTQLAAALSYAHATAKTIHRDLKPSNLLVSAQGDLKIADFGISATLSETVTRLTQSTTISGTPPYMSPQQMRGAPPTPADDVYSFGATLYEFLTGKPPFFRGDIAHQIKDVVPTSIERRRAEFDIPNPRITPVWEKLVAACLSKTPTHRPPTSWLAEEISPRVAVLDDCPAMYPIYQAIFQGRGWQITFHRRKDEFLESLPWADSQAPILVITDVTSPGMKGLEFLKAFKATARGRTIPVIVASGSISGQETEARLLGAFGCLRKPFSLADLFGLIDSAITP